MAAPAPRGFSLAGQGGYCLPQGAAQGSSLSPPAQSLGFLRLSNNMGPREKECETVNSLRKPRTGSVSEVSLQVPCGPAAWRACSAGLLPLPSVPSHRPPRPSILTPSTTREDLVYSKHAPGHSHTRGRQTALNSQARTSEPFNSREARDCHKPLLRRRPVLLVFPRGETESWRNGDLPETPSELPGPGAGLLLLPEHRSHSTTDSRAAAQTLRAPAPSCWAETPALLPSALGPGPPALAAQLQLQEEKPSPDQPSPARQPPSLGTREQAPGAV